MHYNAVHAIHQFVHKPPAKVRTKRRVYPSFDSQDSRTCSKPISKIWRT